jgi:Xaa-Pro aminopeptidase
MESAVHQKRVEECARRMREAGLAALLLTKPANLFYLTGDGRWCSYALISAGGQVALGVPMTDVEEVSALARFERIAGFEDEVGMIHSIAHHFEQFGISSGTVGLEYTYLTQSMMGMLTHPHAKPKEVGVADCTAILSAMRTVKEPAEVQRIRRSAEAAAAGMRAAIRSVKPGATESRVAAEAERAMRLAGAEGFYRTYVSSGPRTNLAHGLPTNRRIAAGELVMIDLAPIVDGYSADLCRTVCAGKPTTAQQAAYELFLRAQQATIARVRAGADMAGLEATMHSTLKEPGREKQVFGPPIHGVGIEFEEAPLPAGHAFFHGEKAPPLLERGTVLAVGNCGLYTGPWGVRVEDTVEVTQDGPVMLTRFPCSLRK